jgi:hypothetical protein
MRCVGLMSLCTLSCKDNGAEGVYGWLHQGVGENGEGWGGARHNGLMSNSWHCGDRIDVVVSQIDALAALPLMRCHIGICVHLLAPSPFLYVSKFKIEHLSSRPSSVVVSPVFLSSSLLSDGLLVPVL